MASMTNKPAKHLRSACSCMVMTVDSSSPSNQRMRTQRSLSDKSRQIKVWIICLPFLWQRCSQQTKRKLSISGRRFWKCREQLNLFEKVRDELRVYRYYFETKHSFNAEEPIAPRPKKPKWVQAMWRYSWPSSWTTGRSTWSDSEQGVLLWRLHCNISQKGQYMHVSASDMHYDNALAHPATWAAVFKPHNIAKIRQLPHSPGFALLTPSKN